MFSRFPAVFHWIDWIGLMKLVKDFQCRVTHWRLVEIPKSISCRAQYVILHNKIGWRKPTICRFGSAKLPTLPWPVKGAWALCTSRKECNKYDLTAAQCFWLAHHNDSSRWSSSPAPICCSSFRFMGGVEKKEYITKLGCEKYIHMVTYWAKATLDYLYKLPFLLLCPY